VPQWHDASEPYKLTYDDHKMIIGHRNYRSYDEVMIKLPYDEFRRFMIIIIFFENMVIDVFCLLI